MKGWFWFPALRAVRGRSCCPCTDPQGPGNLATAEPTADTGMRLERHQPDVDVLRCETGEIGGACDPRSMCVSLPGDSPRPSSFPDALCHHWMVDSG